MNPEERQAIIEGGWRQGGLVPRELMDSIQWWGPAPAALPEFAVVVSQDCDVASPRDDEPIVEVVGGAFATAENGNIRFAKNPRRLQVVVDERFANLEMSARGTLDRRRLLTTPAQSTLDDENRKTLATWMARRYRRDALPDAFNRHLEPLKDRVRAKLRPYANHIVPVLVKLNPEREIAPGERYELEFALVLHTGIDADLKDAIEEKCFEPLKGMLGRLFDVTQALFVDADKISYAFRMARKLLDFDDLSLRDADGPAGSVPSQD